MGANRLQQLKDWWAWHTGRPGIYEFERRVVIRGVTFEGMDVAILATQKDAARRTNTEGGENDPNSK